MSFGGYNPNAPLELPIARSRTSSMSSVHSQPSQQQHPYGSNTGSPYGSQPGTPGGGGGGSTLNDGYFSPGIVVGQQHHPHHPHPHGGGNGGSGASTPASAASSYCPTPPIPNQQHQHAGYMPAGSGGGPTGPTAVGGGGGGGGGGDHSGYSSGYESPVPPGTPTGGPTSSPYGYGASRSHHRRLHSRNSSQGSLLIDTSIGAATTGASLGSGYYSPGPASLSSHCNSASSSRRNSVSSDFGGAGPFLRKGGGGGMVGFRPEESEIMIGHLIDPHGGQGPKGKRGSSGQQKKTRRRSKGGPNSGGLHGGGSGGAGERGAGGGGTRGRGAFGRIGVHDILNDWDILLPTADGCDDDLDDDDDDDDDDENADERWKRRQLRKRGWESTRGQTIIVGLLLILAIFVRIWKLAVPAAVVFDEQHFGGFTVDYIRGEFFLDVHPPLGKMLFALVAYLLGFDGQFSFDLGKLYPANVPFIGLRLFSAMCGVGLVPISYWTIRKAGFSTQAAIICALLVTFENAMITQSRFILLDAPMMLFMGYTMLAWISFYNYRNRPFSRGWWLWLVQTGFGLFLSSSVKWVGLFTITTIGCCVIKYLQEVRTQLYLSTRNFLKQFIALFFCLLVLPVVLYIGLFALDFRLLPNSGSGDSWVSPQFQMTLKNHNVQPVMADIGWESKVHIRHANTNGGWIHSMRGEYARDGTVDQAIQLVEWDDELTCWQVFPADPVLVRRHEKYERDRRFGAPAESLSGFDRLVYHGDEIRMRHCYSKAVMATNDLASIGSNKTFLKEVRAIPWTKDPLEETTWRVELVPDGLVPGLPDTSKGGFILHDENSHFENLADLGLHPSGRAAVSKDKPDTAAATAEEANAIKEDDQEKPRSALRDVDRPWHAIKGFRLWNEKHQCYLQSHKVFRSAYSMYQEVGCIQGGRQKANTIFIVDQNINKKLPARTKSISYQPLTFFQKFIELNRVMWWTHHDLNVPLPAEDYGNLSVKRATDESRPWSWPFLNRGLSYYASKETNHYIYFMGNPLLWWSASSAAVLYMLSCLWSTLKYIQGTPSPSAIERRDRFGLSPFYAVASGTFYAGWAIHFFPFFFIQRQLYLHHYLPALYFSILLLVTRLDRLWQRWPNHARYGSGFALLAIVLLSWYSFSPLAYGIDFGSRARCERVRSIGAWDFVCHRANLPWARPQSPRIVVEKRSDHEQHDHDDDDDDDGSDHTHGILRLEDLGLKLKVPRGGDAGGNPPTIPVAANADGAVVDEHDHEHLHAGPFEESDRQHYEHEHFKHPPGAATNNNNNNNNNNAGLLSIQQRMEERSRFEAEWRSIQEQLQQQTVAFEQLDRQGGNGGNRQELLNKIQALRAQNDQYHQKSEEMNKRHAEAARKQQQEQQQQQAKEEAERKRVQEEQLRQQQEREKQEREKQEREKQEREKQEREKQEREKQEREKQERERQEREQREKQERERQEREKKQEREKQEREKQEREKQEREKREREERENRERQEREKREREEREKREREEREKREREEQERRKQQEQQQQQQQQQPQQQDQLSREQLEEQIRQLQAKLAGQ